MAAPERVSRVKFAGKDFATFFDEIVEEVSANFGDESNDFTESSLGTMFIDLVAFGLDTIAFYLDFEAGENFIDTAQLDNSVILLARQIGFSLRGSVSGSTTLDMTLNKAQDVEVPIRKGFQWLGPNGLVFENVNDIVISAGVTTASMLVSEGETKEERFRSDGLKNQVLRLVRVPSGKSIVEGSVEVFVDNNEVEIVDFLEFRQELMCEAVIRTDPPQIKFGDGNAGSVPSDGAEIKIVYRVGNGELGNAIANSIKSSRSPLVVNSRSVLFTVTNPLKVTGGSPLESIDKARLAAPRVFRAQNVAVTKDDIEGIALSFVDGAVGAVATATAVSIRSAAADAVLNGYLATLRVFADFDYDVAFFNPGTPLGDVVGVLSGTENADMSAAVVSIQNKLASDQGVIANVTASPVTTEELAKITSAAATFTGGAYATSLADILTQANMSVVKAEVDASGASAGEKTSIKAKLDLKTVALTIDEDVIGNLSTTSKATIDAAVTAIGSELSTNNATLATAEVMTLGYDADIQVLADTIDLLSPTEKVDLQNALTALKLNLDTNQADVSGAEAGLFVHINNILENDGRANLIQVYILTIEHDGFYVAASEGLQLSLQSYLEARKETTATIEVLDGSSQLVAADMTVDIRVLVNANASEVVSSVKAKIDDLLRGRKFGVSLRISDVYSAVVSVSGVDFAHVEITGDLVYVDGNGDLVIDGTKVVTKGVITLVQV